MIKHLYGDGAKGTKLLTMCNIWVSRKEIAIAEEFNIVNPKHSFCKECKLEQEKRDKLDVS